MHIEKHEGTAVLTYFIVLLILVISNLISKVDILSLIYLIVLLSCMVKFILIVYKNEK